MDREEYLELVKINTGIEITSVESTNIEGIGYNVKKHHLWVSFKNNNNGCVRLYPHKVRDARCCCPVNTTLRCF